MNISAEFMVYKISRITQEPSVRFHARDKCSMAIDWKKAMEADLTWIRYGATSGHLMNHKRRTAKRKEVRWSAHNFHTSMNVCMLEIENNWQLHLR